MNKIKKALDVLSKTENPIIKADMIKVLREQFTGLENSFDDSCNHNAELTEQKEELLNAVKAAFGKSHVACGFAGNINMTLNKNDLDLIRQWFNSIEDVNPEFIDDHDRILVAKIERLVMAGQE